jgi:hypothetical protein
MDSASIAARSLPAVWLVQLIKWEAVGFTALWTTGGFLVWGADTYVDRHPTYGVLGDLPPFEDGVDSQTTRYNLSIFPPDAAAFAEVADRKHARSKVTIWDASVDPETGLMIGEPDLLFTGHVDFPRIVNGETWEVILECATEEALLNEPNQQRRLSHSHHSDTWPDELGLIHATGLGRKIYWRAQQPTAVSSGGGFGGGAGGGVDSQIY